MQQPVQDMASNAFHVELRRFDAALLAVIEPFETTAAELNLIESRNTLVAFMNAVIDPHGFASTAPVEEIMASGYSNLAHRKYDKNLVTILDLSWMTSSVGLQYPFSSMISSPLTTQLKEMAIGLGLIPIPNVEAHVLAELSAAIETCVRNALQLRLREVKIATGFADLAFETISKIVYYGAVARITRHHLLEKLLKFEELLKNGVLPLGRDQSTPPNVYGLRFFKTLDREAVSLQTEMDMGSKDSRRQLARHKFMSKINELARWMPVGTNLNGPLRFWVSFMKQHVESGRFGFGSVTAVEILAAANNLVDSEISGILLFRADHELAHLGREWRLAEQHKRTIQNPFGSSLWFDTFEEENETAKVLIQDPAAREDPTLIAAKKRRAGIRQALKEELTPGLDQSLINAGIANQAVRHVLTSSIVQTFFRTFEYAFQGDRLQTVKLQRVLQLYNQGVILLGKRSDDMGRSAVTVAAKE